MNGRQRRKRMQDAAEWTIHKIQGERLHTVLRKKDRQISREKLLAYHF